MMVADIEHLYGKRVVVTCTDGEVYRGLFNLYQSFAEDPDEPEYICIGKDWHDLTEIPMDEIAGVEPA